MMMMKRLWVVSTKNRREINDQKFAFDFQLIVCKHLSDALSATLASLFLINYTVVDRELFIQDYLKASTLIEIPSLSEGEKMKWIKDSAYFVRSFVK